MFRTFVAAFTLTAILAPPMNGQVIAPTRLPQIQSGTLLSIQSVSVKDGVISLIGTNGKAASLPAGTFNGPGGSSIIVVTGRVTQLTPSAGTGSTSLRPVEIQSAVVESGQLFLIGTNGRRHTLADGTYMSSDGPKIVVQNRNISEISGG